MIENPSKKIVKICPAKKAIQPALLLNKLSRAVSTDSLDDCANSGEGEPGGEVINSSDWPGTNVIVDGSLETDFFRRDLWINQIIGIPGVAENRISEDKKSTIN